MLVCVCVCVCVTIHDCGFVCPIDVWFLLRHQCILDVAVLELLLTQNFIMSTWKKRLKNWRWGQWCRQHVAEKMTDLSVAQWPQAWYGTNMLFWWSKIKHSTNQKQRRNFHHPDSISYSDRKKIPTWAEPSSTACSWLQAEQEQKNTTRDWTESRTHCYHDLPVAFDSLREPCSVPTCVTSDVRTETF